MNVDISPGSRGWRLAEDLGLGGIVVGLLLAVGAAPTMVSGPFFAVVGAVAVAVVVLRRRALSVAVVLAGVLVGFFPESGAALAVVAYTVGSREMGARRRGVLLTTVLVVPAIATPIGLWLLDIAVARYHVWAVVTGVVVCGVLPALLGVVVRQRQWLTIAQHDASENLQQAQLLAVSQARMRERSQIAAEMHDLLGHRLSLVALHAGGLELATAQVDPDAHRAAQLIRVSARQALDELRGILGLLRTDGSVAGVPALTAETGTHADVCALVAGSRAAGIEVTLGWAGDDLVDVDENVRRAVHRVVREALTNIHKYAPGAAVAVEVTRASGLVTVTVRNTAHPVADTGARFAPGGGGLAGLQERVRLLGGTLRADPTPDGGFAVVADIPLAGSGQQLAAVVPFEADATPASAPTQALGFGLPRLAIVAVAVLFSLVVLAGVQSTLGSLMLGFVAPDQGSSKPQLGISLREFVDSHGANDPFSQLAARGQEPEPPAGATCVYQQGNVVTQNPMGLGESPDDQIIVHRFCFVSDTLVDIQDINLTRRKG